MGGRDENGPHNSTAQHGCRQGASCLLLFCAECGACLFLTLSLANPAVENHSMMSIQQELLPDEASLASGSWTPVLSDRKSPVGMADAPRHRRSVFPRLAPLTVPVTSQHALQTRRDRIKDAVRGEAQTVRCWFFAAAYLLLCLPPTALCGLFSLEFVRKTEFQHPACEGGTSVRAPR